MTTYIRSAVLMVIYTETEVIEDHILQLGCRGIKYNWSHPCVTDLLARNLSCHRSHIDIFGRFCLLYTRSLLWKMRVLVDIHLKTTTASQRVVKFSHGNTKNFATYSYYIFQDE